MCVCVVVAWYVLARSCVRAIVCMLGTYILPGVVGCLVQGAPMKTCLCAYVCVRGEECVVPAHVPMKTSAVTFPSHHTATSNSENGFVMLLLHTN